jgi:TetR/AcrR family transcriptional regulator, transcriptional repressor for nem operon
MQANINTQDRIINVAKVLFHNRSYSDVGVKEICDKANIQKGSFYHFFSSKQDLAVAVIEEFSNEWAYGLIAEAFDPKLAPMDRIDYMIDAAYFWQKSAKNIEGRMPGCLFGNLALEVSTQDEILRAKLMAVFNTSKSKFDQTLKQAVEQGAIEKINTELTAEAMLAYLEGMILLAKANNDPELLYRLGPALKTIRIYTHDL